MYMSDQVEFEEPGMCSWFDYLWGYDQIVLVVTLTKTIVSRGHPYIIYIHDQMQKNMASSHQQPRYVKPNQTLSAQTNAMIIKVS